MLKIKVGTVLRYFSKTQMAIVELTQDIAKGDELVFVCGDNTINHVINDIIFNYEKYDFAGKGEIVGIKINEEVKTNAEVFKIQK